MTDLHDTISFITTEAAKIARQWLLQCIAYSVHELRDDRGRIFLALVASKQNSS